MIRTASIVFLVLVSAATVRADQPIVTQTVPQVANVADCASLSAELERGGKWQIMRGNADLADRYIAPASVDAVATV